MNNTIKLVNTDSVLENIKQNKRIDGRSFDSYRNIEIKTGIIPSADGSAWVKLGNTEVIAGITFVVGTPYPDSLDKGSMSLNLELSGVSSPDFSTGPPQIDSVEFGRIADRAIRHSEFIDFKKLCVVPGEKVFIVFIDCIAINADGNLIDATQFAALNAILNAKIPVLDDDYRITKEYTTEGVPVNMGNLPLSITFEKIGDKIVIDPNSTEEFCSNARFSVGLVKDTFVSCQKSKFGTFNEEEISSMLDLAVAKYSELIKKVKKWLLWQQRKLR